jgi:hypothetical protein
MFLLALLLMFIQPPAASPQPDTFIQWVDPPAAEPSDSERTLIARARAALAPSSAP